MYSRDNNLEAEGRFAEIKSLTDTVPSCLRKLVESVHIDYAPAGAGRIAFGGRLVTWCREDSRRCRKNGSDNAIAASSNPVPLAHDAFENFHRLIDTIHRAPLVGLVGHFGLPRADDDRWYGPAVPAFEIGAIC